MRYLLVMVAIALFAVFGVVIIFGRGGGNGSSVPEGATKVADYENNDAARLSFTIQGKVVGEDQRRAVRITVTRDTRTIEILSGYGERVEKSAEFSNSDEGFATFSRALDGLQFGRQRDVRQADDRAACPLGYRYIYRLTDGGKEIMRSWSTSCRRNEGNFAGQADDIRTLFKRQITGYDDFVRGLVI